jgi:hypothetical protein
MRHFELTPLLTDADAAESSEGGLDPLGTESMADTLAVKLIPGVRERQQHPRFLTATAVSLSLCAEFDDEVLARDGVSEPWLVFEWYVVEGLVRTRGRTPKDIRGLPGREKAARAIADGVPLSAKRYLKAPSVFGFHGIYRLLARTLGIEQGERLGERGYELLGLWARERGLGGFIGTAGGPGKRLRDQLCEALRLGLEKGAVARTKAWAGWGFFSEHLAPYEFGGREARFLSSLLLDDAEGFRSLMPAADSGKGRFLTGATLSDFFTSSLGDGPVPTCVGCYERLMLTSGSRGSCRMPSTTAFTKCRGAAGRFHLSNSAGWTR